MQNYTYFSTFKFYPRRTPSNNFTHDKHAKFQVSKSYEQPVVSFSDSVTGKEVLYEYVDQKSLSLNTTLDGGLKRLILKGCST